jgi:indole-3-glycerol phosphate synthase
MLDALVENARQRVRERERRRSLRAVERAASEAPAPRGFAQALAAAPTRLGLVAELKKASPSAGVLREDFDVASLARAYARGGAHALSVLTEQDHFQGALDNLERAYETGLPLLQKDFVISEYQIFEGRGHGADAVLLIAEALQPDRLHELAMLALDLGLDVLCEAHEPRNVRRMAGIAERDPEHILVGVNNRDLRTFEVSIETSLRALQELPRGLLVVAESGIRTGDDLVKLREAGARGALVGECLIRSPDVEAATRALLAPLGST